MASNDKHSNSNSEQIITRSDIQKVTKSIQNIDRATQEFAGFTKLLDQKGYPAISSGTAHHKRYENYYDVFHTITTAGPIDPNDFDSPVYNVERVFEELERYSDIIFVSNNGTNTLFCIISHGGRTNFSQETPIFPGEVKTYYNTYELRLRSPTAGLPYRITEYDINNVSQTSSIPIEKAVLHNQSLPPANTNWLSSDIVPTRTPTTFRIQTAVSIAGNFSVAITNGGNTQVVMLNIVSGPTLIANGIYIFDIMAHSGDSINFRYSTTQGMIQILRVQEIDSAVT